MKKYLLSASVIALVATAACTALTAPEETKKLKFATSVFTTAVSDARTARTQASADMEWEDRRSNVATGAPMPVTDDCLTPVQRWSANFTHALATPRNWRNYDTVFAQRVTLAACDFRGHDALPEDLPEIDDSLANPRYMMRADAVDLGQATTHLNDYVEALADIATGETASETDAAQAQLVTAAQGLATAIDSSNNVTGPLIGLVGAAVQSIVNARRNAVTRDFLRQVDPAMPDLMERLGVAARIEVANALFTRARASQAVARYANRALPEIPLRRRTANRVYPDRLRQFDEIAARLERHNGPFRQLRLADPMVAARAFAKAHHALTAVFNDPRANRRDFATAFRDFLTKASALAEALAKASSDS